MLFEVSKHTSKKLANKHTQAETPTPKPVDDYVTLGNNDHDAVLTFRGTASCGSAFFSWCVEGNTLMRKFRITIRNQDNSRFIC